jgi:hypothetical protein
MAGLVVETLEMEVSHAFEHQIATPDGVSFMRDFFVRIKPSDKIDLNLWADVLTGRIEWLQECIHLILLHGNKHSVVFEEERFYREVAFTRIFRSIQSCIYYEKVEFIKGILSDERVMSIIKNTPLLIPDRFLKLIGLLKQQKRPSLFGATINMLWLDPDFFKSSFFKPTHAELISFYFKEDLNLQAWWQLQAPRIIQNIATEEDKKTVLQALLSLCVETSTEKSFYQDLWTFVNEIKVTTGASGIHLTASVFSLPNSDPSPSGFSERETPLGPE